MLPNTTAGFAINGMDPAPFKVCKIEKDSPAEKSGLKLKDALVSVNGRSIADSSYEDAIAVIKEELLKKRIQLVVQKYHSSKSERSQAEQRSSNSDISGISVSQGYQNDSAKGAAQCSNPVQQYKGNKIIELMSPIFFLRSFTKHRPTNERIILCFTFVPSQCNQQRRRFYS